MRSLGCRSIYPDIHTQKKAENDVNGVSGRKNDDDEIVDIDITGELDYDEGFSYSDDWELR